MSIEEPAEGTVLSESWTVTVTRRRRAMTFTKNWQPNATVKGTSDYVAAITPENSEVAVYSQIFADDPTAAVVRAANNIAQEDR